MRDALYPLALAVRRLIEYLILIARRRSVTAKSLDSDNEQIESPSRGRELLVRKKENWTTELKHRVLPLDPYRPIAFAGWLLLSWASSPRGSERGRPPWDNMSKAREEDHFENVMLFESVFPS